MMADYFEMRGDFYSQFMQMTDSPSGRWRLPWCFPNFDKGLVAWMLFVFGVSGSAFAELPPLTVEELTRGSDLIVEVDVLSVAKTGAPDSAIWLAQLHIRKTLKGTPPSSPMPYWFLPPEPSLAGGKDRSAFAGQHLRLYLIRGNSGQFEAWASNSVELLEHFDKSRYVLPKRLGEVLHADGGRSTLTRWQSERVCGRGSALDCSCDLGGISPERHSGSVAKPNCRFPSRFRWNRFCNAW